MGQEVSLTSAFPSSQCTWSNLLLYAQNRVEDLEAQLVESMPAPKPHIEGPKKAPRKAAPAKTKAAKAAAVLGKGYSYKGAVNLSAMSRGTVIGHVFAENVVFDRGGHQIIMDARFVTSKGEMVWELPLTIKWGGMVRGGHSEISCAEKE